MAERLLTAFQQRYMDRISFSYFNGELNDLLWNLQIAEINIKKDVYLLSCPIIQRFETIVNKGYRLNDSEKLDLVMEIERIFPEKNEVKL